MSKRYSAQYKSSAVDQVHRRPIVKLLVAGATGWYGVGRAWLANISINEAGYVVQSGLNGENPTAAGAAATFAGTSLGYGIGKYTPQLLNPYVMQTLRPGVTQANPNVSILFQVHAQRMVPGTNYKVPSNFFTRAAPSIVGTGLAPFGQELIVPPIEGVLNTVLEANDEKNR